MINDTLQSCLVPYDFHPPLSFVLQRHPNYLSWKYSLGKPGFDVFDNDASYLMCAHIKIKWLTEISFLFSILLHIE